MSNIRLSADSIRTIIEVCEAIKLEDPDNETTVNLCDGIGQWVEDNEFLTKKQAAWFRRNAKYHGFEVPDELFLDESDEKAEIKTKRKSDDLEPAKNQTQTFCRLLVEVKALLKDVAKTLKQSG